jgi:hypothetical protein
MAVTHRLGSTQGAELRAGGLDAIEVHGELMSLTVRMVGEYPQFPAGSVMRCVSRAVRHAVVSGTPPDQIPGDAERAARRVLAGRLVAPPAA